MSSGVGTNSKSRSICGAELGVRHRPDHVEARQLIEASWAAIERCLDSAPITEALSHLEFVRSCADASEATLLAARLESGASPRSVESLLQKNEKTSKRTAKTRTRRANAVKANPGIAKKIASGELSPDQADVLATAAERTDGAAAKDETLIEKVAATPPDQAKKVADEWVREHTAADTVQDRYDRQRRLRCVKRWTTDRHTHVLALEGDEASIDRVELAIRNRSSEMWRADGGRELSAGEHPRTRDHRNFDAAVELFTRHDGFGGGDPVGGGRTTGSGSSPSRQRPRSTIVVTMSADQMTGSDPSPVRQVASGLLAPTLLAEMFCGSELVGQVVDGSGQVLWQGRTKRYFTDEQLVALIARDHGCVQCGAHYSTCDAHHIIPWESPARGPTDIENGALLCSDCHHRVHEHELVLMRDPTSGTWSTRPARPHEIAPKRSAPDTTRTIAQSASDNRSERGRPKLHERRRTGALW